MTEIVRPVHGLIGWGTNRFLANFGAIASIMRAVWPVGPMGIFRHDDVREVFERDDLFGVVYKDKLDVIMDGEPFFLGLPGNETYWAQLRPMRAAAPPSDVSTKILPMVAEEAERRLAAANGRIDVVEYTRRITEAVLCRWFGTPPPPGVDMALWGQRLFEYQFVSSDAPLVAEVREIAPKLRAHVDALIAARRAAHDPGDDVMGRAVAAGIDPVVLRSALIGCIVGGLPQPPMVTPQALNELFKRPGWLAAAAAAARGGDAPRLGRLVREAMRFDPLAPGVKRVVLKDAVIGAQGDGGGARVAAGKTLLVSFHSAMHDPARVANPSRFDPDRPDCDYIHFGHSLHRCFGAAVNQAIIPAMLAPLLIKPGLRRAGRLEKRGAFAARLQVEWASESEQARALSHGRRE